MLTINTHEAKTKLSSLLLAVEKKKEVVVICRNGHPVAELHAVKDHKSRSLPAPSGRLAPHLFYDPTEPASEDEWPEI